MGASGAGKSTVGRLLAARTGAGFVDADDLHQPANVAKMRRGEALDDADRAPWLEALHALLVDRAAAGRPTVLACSALKAAYRRRLVDGLDGVRFVYLRAERALLEERLGGRRGHFFPADLLDSQLAALEEPADAVVVDAGLPPDAIVDRLV